MAMIKCHECSKEISSEAKSCPHCGAEPEKKTSRLSLGIAGIVLFMVLYGVFTHEEKPAPLAKSPAEIRAEQERQRDFQQAAGAVIALRNGMKNPKSFELVSAHMMSGRTLCVVYRGTNSFNAVITSHYVVSPSVSSDSKTAWNKHCAGQSGINYDHIRHAL